MLASFLEPVVAQLAQLPNVVAIKLGGSRARGEERPDSDWDLGLYYRGEINASSLRALGYEGHVVEPGDWGRLVNGGGWLIIDGQRVDVLYRDLDFVEHWVREAEQGRFEVDNVGGYIVGMATYVLVGELALGQVLSGSLPHPTYPPALQQKAPAWWYGSAAFSLIHADSYAAKGAVTPCAGMLVKAIMAVAQARIAERGEWALNEKRLLKQAGLSTADEILTQLSSDPAKLIETVERVRKLVGLGRSQSGQFDEVVKTE